MSIYEQLSLIISLASALVVAASTLLVYRQVRIASKSWQLNGIVEVNTVIKEINNNCEIIYNFPIELAASIEQFAKKPPSKHKIFYISDTERRRMQLNDKQKECLSKLSEEDIKIAKDTISLLNDVGQLVEDGYASYSAFLSKTHCTIIRITAFLEPIRQMQELDINSGMGGNYGHRILRMRKMALIYNQIHPKHRSVPIYISNAEGRREIVPVFQNTLVNKIRCTFLKLKYFHILFK